MLQQEMKLIYSTLCKYILAVLIQLVYMTKIILVLNFVPEIESRH